MNMAGKSYEFCPGYHLKAMTLHEVAVVRGNTVRSAPIQLSRDQVAPLKGTTCTQYNRLHPLLSYASRDFTIRPWWMRRKLGNCGFS